MGKRDDLPPVYHKEYGCDKLYTTEEYVELLKRRNADNDEPTAETGEQEQ
jgi:hypothetical protein